MTRLVMGNHSLHVPERSSHLFQGLVLLRCDQECSASVVFAPRIGWLTRVMRSPVFAAECNSDMEHLTINISQFNL